MSTLPALRPVPTPAPTEAPPPDHLVSIGEIAQQLGVQPRSIYRWVSAGTFPQAKYRLPGGRSRWTAEQIETFLREHEAEPDHR